MNKYKGREKEYLKEYKRQWHIKNREKIIERVKKWQAEHKEERTLYLKEYYKRNEDKINKKNSEWAEKNPEKLKIIRSRATYYYELKHPEKVKARSYAQNNKQKDTECSHCETTENLHFHHTDYEKNEGFTLCKNCHKLEHQNAKKNRMDLRKRRL